MTFLAADGVTPSNEGRGYVMRRDHPARRAAGDADRARAAVPRGLAGIVVEQMHEAYPELDDKRGEIESVLSAEEERFGETLAAGSCSSKRRRPTARSPARRRSAYTTPTAFRSS
jgi:alanyl-tRNA synthetase